MFWFLRKFKKTAIRSSINNKIIIGGSYGRKTLFVDDVPQSGGELYSMWKKVIESIAVKQPVMKRCLVLGVGGGDVIRVLEHYYPRISIIGVERDPVMLQIAKNHFGLLETKAFLVLADAAAYIARVHKKDSFDCIIVDLFIGRLNPQSSRTKTFLMQLKKLLMPSGFVLYNSHYQEENSEEFADFLKLCRSVFSQTKEVFAYKKNRLLLLSNIGKS